MPTKDEKLLETETPQDQVDRMGNGWTLPGQYEKQLQLPVHLTLAPDRKNIVDVVKDNRTGTVPGYTTKCGLVLGGEVLLRTTDDPDDATCQACLKG